MRYLAPGRFRNQVGTNSKLEWPQHLRKSKVMMYTNTKPMEAVPMAAAPRMGTHTSTDCSPCSSMVVTNPAMERFHQVEGFKPRNSFGRSYYVEELMTWVCNLKDEKFSS